jgi:hypothetical protein
MTWIQVDVLPQSSVADQVLVTMLAAGQKSAATISMKVITGVVSQLSVAVAIPVSSSPMPSPQATVISGGHVIIGGVLSSTVMI